MNGGGRHLLVTLAFLGNAMASPAEYADSWDGVWTGKLDDTVTVSVQIANDRAVDDTIAIQKDRFFQRVVDSHLV